MSNESRVPGQLPQALHGINRKAREYVPQALAYRDRDTN